MSKKLLIFALLIIFAFSFTLFKRQVSDEASQIETGPIGSDQQKNSQPWQRNCSSYQQNNFYLVIAQCQTSNLTATAECIKAGMQARQGSRWNVFVKSSASQAGVSYWYFNNCWIPLNNYGKYNRTYIGWPAQKYGLDLARGQEEDNQEKSVDLNNEKNDANCSSTRGSDVVSAINSCQQRGLDEQKSATCLMNMLTNNTMQYWDAYISSSNAQATVKYWFYDNCTLTYPNFGKNNRTFTVWRAT